MAVSHIAKGGRGSLSDGQGWQRYSGRWSRVAELVLVWSMVAKAVSHMVKGGRGSLTDG